MGLPNELISAMIGAAGQDGAYQINQSLRFNPADSARLYRTLDASQTRTYSFWYKYANLSGGNMYLFHHKNSGDTNYLGVRSGGSPSENQWQTLNQGSSFTEINSSRKYRDPSAWQHVLWKCTSTNVTMYVNGVEFASTGGANTSLTGGTLEIGARGSAEYFGGYIAEFHFVDGTAYNPSDFGEIDAITGAWIPKRFSGTYGTNGFYLKFDPSATNGIGHDHSGNGNNFTATGFSTSGTGTDVMSDTPTNNWCTLNPLAVTNSSLTLSEGNLKAVTPTTGGGNAYGTFAIPSSGKWYWEISIDSSNAPMVGISIYDATQAFAGSTSSNVLYYSSGQKYVDGTGSAYGSSYTGGDLIGVACDSDANTIQFYKNGTAQGSISHTIGGLFPVLTDGGNSVGDTYTINFGQRAFAYTPPTGYKALSTGNLPEPTIKKGGAHFNTVLYNGTGAELAVSGVGFQPDFTWLKRRNNVSDHHLFDAVRGVTKGLFTNDTKVEETNAQFLKTFDTDGFTLGTNGGLNGTGSTNVAWNWKANGAGSSNEAGSITSTVSANATAGFSIVTYTGNATAGATVGHGLGVAPKMIIVKNRDVADNWLIQHASLGPTKYLLFTTAAAGTTGLTWNDTAPTSTVFTLGSGDPNQNTRKFVAYCFSEVAGYSKFGSYTGNGSLDGVFNYCGFKPAWLLVKRTNTTANWHLVDSTRSPYNLVNTIMLPDLSDQEDTYTNGGVDLVSNGFKIRSTGGAFNASGDSYIFAAFAELPAKYSNAR